MENKEMEKVKLEDKIFEYNALLGERIGWLEKSLDLIRVKRKEEENTKKKKIAIVYDVDGWAFHNISKEIKKNLSKFYDIDIIPKSVFNHNVIRLMFLAKKYDLVHVLWRGMFSEIDGEFSKEYIKSLGLTKEEFVKEFVEKANITTSVYDHSFLNKEAFWITEAYLKYTKGYTVSSKKLKDIYDNLKIDKKPSMEITDGVDLSKFVPQNLERFLINNIQNRVINIGWVGNSKFEDSENDDDLKGVRKIIIPVIEELKKEGYNVERKFADRNEGYIPHDKMPDYYNSIDLYVCASKEEGTPNPVLESMASGVPVISTDVGIVSEAFGEKQKDYIIERTKEDLKEKIIDLLKNREKFEILSKENLEQIKNWSWEKKCEQFKEFFDESIKKFEEVS